LSVISVDTDFGELFAVGNHADPSVAVPFAVLAQAAVLTVRLTRVV
jgi:hypothetical protein